MTKIPYLLACLLFSYGLYLIVSSIDRFKRLAGLILLQNGVILLFVAMGQVARPLRLGISINPVPSVLMLTAIVVGFAVICVALSLLAAIENKNR